jgi:hypothetical protein
MTIQAQVARDMLFPHMGTAMIELDHEIAAYETMRADLENRHLGEWALVFGEKLIGVFPSFEEAAQIAVQEFGRGPYLIRQVGSSPISMPASVMYHLSNANDKMRV